MQNIFFKWQLDSDTGRTLSSTDSDKSSIFSFLNISTIFNLQSASKTAKNRNVKKTVEVQIPAGVLPNFSGDYMVRMFYIDPDYFRTFWKYEDVTLGLGGNGRKSGGDKNCN